MLSMEWNLEDALRVKEKDGALNMAEKIAEKLLDILDVETIAEKTELSVEKVRELKAEYDKRV